MTDGRGSFYYLTSDLLNPNFHGKSRRSNLIEDGSCAPVGSFNEQFGPSMNNNFILVHINEHQYDQKLQSNAITIDDLRQSLQVPQRSKNYVYSVQAGRTNIYTETRTGYPRTKTHYIKPGSTAQLMVLPFTVGIRHAKETPVPAARGSKQVLKSKDAGLWVHIQDVPQPNSNAPLPRPDQPGCMLVGHVACTKDDGTGEVLVHPLTDTINGLVACLDPIAGVSGRKS
ncbi:hypothetical protein SLS62_002467 [Diatrype stigma]|uniref:Uncharacterized protein n=1 Tax=Diatrype stigma TaxID=117547 RepID=A0AAN9UWJ3_9PEZI